MNRIQKTFFSVFCGRGIMAIRQFLLVPIFIRAWGVDYYGSWLVLSAIPSFLSMSNLGLGTSASMKIAVLVAAGKTEEAWENLTTCIWMISALGVLVTLATSGWMAWWHRAKPGAGGIEMTTLVVALLLISLFVRMLSQPLSGWWTGVGKPAVANQFVNLNSTGELVLSAVLPLLGNKALILASILLVWNIVWMVFFMTKTYNLARESHIKLPLTKVDLRLGRGLVGTGLGHQLSPLWQAILFQGSLVLANSLLGPAGAALWGSLRVAIRSGNQLLELISQSLGPEFQLALGNGDRDKLRRLHSAGLVSSLLLSSGMAIGLVTLGPHLFNIWTHHAFVTPSIVWWLMSLSLIPYALWWISGEYQRASNQPWLLNLWGIFAAALSISCMAAGAKFGIQAFAFGALIFEVCMAAFVLPRTLHLLDDHLVTGFTRGFDIIWRRFMAISRRNQSPAASSL